MDFEHYTDKSKAILQTAQRTALASDHQRFMPEHVLFALSDDNEGSARRLIAAARGGATAAQRRTSEALLSIPRVEGAGAGSLHLAPENARVFEMAENLAKKAKDEFVTVERLLQALAMVPVTKTASILSDAGVNAQA